MSNKVCVTGGSAYTDIDVLACAIAFAELNSCVAILPGEFNATIPESVRKWNFKFATEFPKSYDQIVVVDVSNPKYFPQQIPENKIVKVFDHHTGFENYWRGKGQIEFVGACATLIFELFGETKPSSVTANLLYTAIFANTLNFNASVTTQRDIQAFEKLKNFIDLPKNWIEQYYSEVEKRIFENFDKAIKNDTKILSNGWAIAQIELYDAVSILKNRKFLKSLEHCMNDHLDWLLTMPSISEGRNYLVTNSEKVKRIISAKINSDWDGFNAKTRKLYLRKEILKILELQ